MKIVFDDTFTNEACAWKDLEPGYVYQAVDTSSLLAIKSAGTQGLCLRGGNGVSPFDVWTPGRESLWRKVEAQLNVSAVAL